MNKLAGVLLAGLLALSVMTSAMATHPYQYRTIYSPGCGPIKITRIAGPAVVTLAARLTQSGHISGYVITLDTRLLSFRDLYLRLGQHGCFNQK